MPAASVEVPVINGHHAVQRHPPAIVAPVEELPLTRFWHGEPACEVDHKEVDWAALGGRTAAPLEVDVRHHGGVARLRGWLSDPRTCKVNARVDRHHYALLRQILSAHNRKEDEGAEDDPEQWERGALHLP
jgi:hypothetical protein